VLSETLEAILEDNGVKLYDMELTEENDQKIFRVYITSDETITLDKCADISHIISPIIDLNPPTNDTYFLEVSSPGIERALKKPKHFINSIGETIKLKTNSSKKIIAKLVNADEDGITLEYNGKKESLKYSDINKARTYFEW
jgi:ribosome maturation factor RimP